MKRTYTSNPDEWMWLDNERIDDDVDYDRIDPSPSTNGTHLRRSPVLSFRHEFFELFLLITASLVIITLIAKASVTS